MAQKTQVQQFYTNQTIFLTGGTGFLGKLIVEKLLRTCRDVRKIFLLVRQKKGINEEQRLKNIFEAEAFDVLKKEVPDFLQKVQLIAGDCIKPKLGLSDNDINLLINEVNIIFHVAATVKFNEHIKIATYINVRASRDLINLAKQIKNFKCFVHVSTAYANCIRKNINEEVYEPSITGQNLINLVDALDEEVLTKITPILIGNHPNTYVFTKQIAEEIVTTEGKSIPIAIVRPSIVFCTIKDPIPGWIDNIFGATGVALGAALGVIRTIRINPPNVADMVPADYVVGSTVTAGFEVGTEPENNKLKVYNLVSSTQNPITWRKYNQLMEMYGRMYPSKKIIWHYCFSMRPNLVCNTICMFLMHTIPAYLIDLVLLIIGKKPLAVEGYKKIHKFSDVISYFGMNEWNFKDDNIKKLAEKLSQEDKDLFFVEISKMQWTEALETKIRGGRKYLLKDSEDTIPEGKKKTVYLKIAHYAVMALLLYFVYVLSLFIYNMIF